MPLDNVQLATINEYLVLKQNISRANESFARFYPHRPVPMFLTAELACAYYLAKGNIYTGDPMKGMIDIYTHPERVQAALEMGPEQIARTYIDCDDVATWYYASLRKAPHISCQIYTLIDANIVGSHVICAYRDVSYGEFGVLDTNGRHVLPDLKPETLCAKWSEIYKDRGYNYVAAVPTPYPWTA